MSVKQKINHKKNQITTYTISKLNTFAVVKNLKQKNEKNNSFSSRSNSTLFL